MPVLWCFGWIIWRASALVVTRKCLCIQARIIQVRLKCHVAGSVLGAQGAQAEEEDRVVQVAADARWGVSAIKAAALQAALGSVEKAEAAALVGRCHLRRTRQGAQVKEIEGQTLLTLGIRDGAEVYVRAGAVRSETQKLLKVFLAASATAAAKPLLQLAADQAATIGEVKDELARRLAKSKDKAVQAAAARGAWPQGMPAAGLLRLRVKKGSAGGGAALRDDQVLVKALPSLRTAEEGALVLQLLDEPEDAAALAHSLAVHVRRWRVVEGREQLDDAREVRVSRQATVLDFLQQLQALFAAGPQMLPAGAGMDEAAGAPAEALASVIEVAKLPGFVAAEEVSKTKLNWVGSAHAHADLRMPVASPPMGLREGAVMVVRAVEEFASFRLEQQRHGQDSAASGAGAGSIAGQQGHGGEVQQSRRAQAGRSRGVVAARREVGLRIHVHGGGDDGGADERGGSGGCDLRVVAASDACAGRRAGLALASVSAAARDAGESVSDGGLGLGPAADGPDSAAAGDLVASFGKSEVGGAGSSAGSGGGAESGVSGLGATLAEDAVAMEMERIRNKLELDKTRLLRGPVAGVGGRCGEDSMGARADDSDLGDSVDGVDGRRGGSGSGVSTSAEQEDEGLYSARG